MSWDEATAYLNALGVDAMKSLKPSLHRINALCDALDHPERRVPAIHIAGTNGKTSTARLATSLLAASGLSIGTFTSPHLSSVRERIAYNGAPVEEEVFGDLFAHVHPLVELVQNRLGEQLSYFELLTGMFLLWAVDAPVDVVVVEAGLGGRWDATNVIPSSCAVLTSVGLDHTSLLGTDRTGIAREKSGIAKSGGVFVCGERDPSIQAVARAEAESLGAEFVAIGRDFDLVESRVAVNGRVVSARTSTGTAYEDVFLALHGQHQALNAAVALEAVSRFLPTRPLDLDIVGQAFADVSVPGRMEAFRVARGRLVLDVAHNPDGMSSLVSALVDSFAFDRLVVVAGFLDDKDYESMILELARVAAVLVATAARTARAVPAAEVARAAAVHGVSASIEQTVPAAVRAALAAAGPEDLVCVTGSHYVVGEARSHLLEQSAARSS